MKKQGLTVLLLAVFVTLAGGGWVNAQGKTVTAEVSQAEPSQTGASRAEPSQTGASRAESSQTGASRAESSQAESTQAETAQAASAIGADEAGSGKTSADTAGTAGQEDAEAGGKAAGGTEGQVTSAVSMENLSDLEKLAFTHLEGTFADNAALLLRWGEDVLDIYSEYDWKSKADAFPVKFDLRNRGTVTSVKDQSPWGTCWSFATMAASETSLLNTLGMTAEEYKAKYGSDMDLSEKHLAWFSNQALPALDEFEEGKYPYDPAQAGEGVFLLESSENSLYNYGGNYALATSLLASGIGVVNESVAPYTNAGGETNLDGDWSLPEEERFRQSFELKDANILPAPAYYNEKGEYEYRESATEMIKSELIREKRSGSISKRISRCPS